MQGSWEVEMAYLGAAEEMYSISKAKPSRASLSLSLTCYQVVFLYLVSRPVLGLTDHNLGLKAYVI